MRVVEKWGHMKVTWWLSGGKMMWLGQVGVSGARRLIIMLFK